MVIFQNAKIISKMDEELENSTRKMQQNMNFSPEVSFQPTESQASVSVYTKLSALSALPFVRHYSISGQSSTDVQLVTSAF